MTPSSGLPAPPAAGIPHAVTSDDPVQALYAGALHRLPSGVYTPGYAAHEVDRHLHRLFNSDAGAADYHARYRQHDYYRALIRRALGEAGVAPAAGASILDIGSGSGNTVLPALSIFPGSSLVATDLSLPLLTILLRSAPAAAVHAVQEHAESLAFRPLSFDVVIGGAILHHLLHPERALARSVRLLRPGGVAMFFEPCLHGQWVLKLGIERVLLDRRAATLTPAVRDLLRRQCRFLRVRLLRRPDEDPAFYARQDDKWLFSKAYLRTALRAAGARDMRLFPLETTATPVEAKLRTHFRLLRQQAPAWVWQLARDFHAEMPGDCRSANPIGIGVVFRR